MWPKPEGDKTKRAKYGRLNLADRFGLIISKGSEIDGLWVGVMSGEEDYELVSQPLQKALSLIKTFDRQRYDRLTRDLERIWVVDLPAARGSYNHRARCCYIDTRFIRDPKTTSEMIAATIVHEATHARLFHYGIGYEEQIRARVEAVCIRREIAFSAKLLDGRQIKEQAERGLKRCGDPAYWTNVAVRNRYIEGTRKLLRSVRMPNWLILLTLALSSIIGDAAQLAQDMRGRIRPAAVRANRRRPSRNETGISKLVEKR